MTTKKLTADAILHALDKSTAGSYSALHRALGGKSNPASLTIKSFKALVPDIDKRLKANRGGVATLQTTGKSKGRKKWKRHPQNPYRLGSYATAFDIVASFKDGLPRAKLEALHAQAMGRTKCDIQKSRFDCAVVLSPKGESPTSERHRSTREGYGISKEGSFIRLVLPN